MRAKTNMLLIQLFSLEAGRCHWNTGSSGSAPAGVGCIHMEEQTRATKISYPESRSLGYSLPSQLQLGPVLVFLFFSLFHFLFFSLFLFVSLPFPPFPFVSFLLSLFFNLNFH